MTVREKIYTILEGGDYLPGRIVNGVIIFLIITSTLILIISTVPGTGFAEQINIFEKSVMVVFTFEYLLRVWSSPDRKKTVTGFLGIIDFISIFPFYLSMLIPGMIIDLRVLRMLRVFRLLRIFKMARYIESINIIALVIREKSGQLVVFMFIIAVLLMLVSSIAYFIEPDNFSSIPDAFWWSIVTLTTVGYGDVYPKTAAGKLFAGIVMLIGIGVIAIPTGIISSGLTEYLLGNKKSFQCKRCKTENILGSNYCRECGEKI